MVLADDDNTSVGTVLKGQSRIPDLPRARPTRSLCGRLGEHRQGFTWVEVKRSSELERQGDSKGMQEHHEVSSRAAQGHMRMITWTCKALRVVKQGSKTDSMGKTGVQRHLT